MPTSICHSESHSRNIDRRLRNKRHTFWLLRHEKCRGKKRTPETCYFMEMIKDNLLCRTTFPPLTSSLYFHFEFKPQLSQHTTETNFYHSVENFTEQSNWEISLFTSIKSFLSHSAFLYEGPAVKCHNREPFLMVRDIRRKATEWIKHIWKQTCWSHLPFCAFILSLK